MNREPIERLITILKSVKDENFYIGTYYNCGPSITIENVNSCGSTACALGHAALDPWFIERGLCVRALGNFYNPRDPLITVQRIFDLPRAFLRELFGTSSGVKEFYGVETRYVTPAMVINKLQKLLNLDN